MSYFELYLITRLESIQVFFIIMPIFIGMGYFMYTLFNFLDNGSKPKKLKTVSSILLISIFIGCIIPSKKDIAFIYGIHYVTNNERLMDLPEGIIDVIEKEIKELKEN